ncbi:MAG: hypothetical protein ACREA2_18790, partial [Blastocatellia bacterium]
SRRICDLLQFEAWKHKFAVRAIWNISFSVAERPDIWGLSAFNLDKISAQDATALRPWHQSEPFRNGDKVAEFWRTIAQVFSPAGVTTIGKHDTAGH